VDSPAGLEVVQPDLAATVNWPEAASPPARVQAPGPPDDELKYMIVGCRHADPSRRSASMQKLYTWLAREDGQTMAEYGVVLAVITIAVFGALALLAGNITGALTRVAGYIT
jgi:Flp pilus assembly pilin Flp